MMRSVSAFRSVRLVLPLLALALNARPGTAQLARARTASPDAPKIIVLPFVRDNQDSALSLLIADGARERLRSNHLDRFNPISRDNLCQNLQQSGFPCDVPLDAPVVRQLVRWINAKYVVEGSMIRRPGDSVLVIGRLAEAAGADPQAATATITATLQQAGTRTGGELVNRLMDGFETFEQVTQCRRKFDLRDYAGAIREAQHALRDFPSNAGAYVCIAKVLEAQNAPADSIIAALRNAYQRDTLNTGIMRRLAQKYQAANDTTNLLVMLKRILTIDFRDNELRISTIRMMAQMLQADSAVYLANQGLRENPANAELLAAKAVAVAASAQQRRLAADSLAAGPPKDSLMRVVSALWDSAGTTMETVADVDSAKVDSMFLVRITNYFRAVPDTTHWIRWVSRATEKQPAVLDNWYTLASVRLVRADTTGALEAARGYAAHVPGGADASNSATQRHHYALSRYLLGALLAGRQPDSAVAFADSSVRADSTLRGANAVTFFQTGMRSYRDSVYAVAVTRLTKAKTFANGRAALVVPASFIMGISQFRIGAHADSIVDQTRNCDSARTLGPIWQSVEENMIAGAAQNRELANQFLSQYIPAYKQRADAFVHNFCR